MPRDLKFYEVLAASNWKVLDICLISLTEPRESTQRISLLIYLEYLKFLWVALAIFLTTNLYLGNTYSSWYWTKSSKLSSFSFLFSSMFLKSPSKYCLITSGWFWIFYQMTALYVFVWSFRLLLLGSALTASMLSTETSWSFLGVYWVLCAYTTPNSESSLSSSLVSSCSFS